MAGINSAVRITDGMSPALKSMNKALNIVLSSFEKLQTVSATSIDVSDIEAARTELNNAATAVSRLEDELQNAGNAQERLTREVRESDGAMDKLTGRVKGLVAAYAGFQSLKKLVGLSDEITQNNSRLNLIVDTDESVEDLKQKIFDSANRARADYLDTTSAVTAFAQRAGDAFSNNDEVIAFSETLNKMYVIAGAGAQEQASSMLQLTQALGSGVLRGEEFNAVFEAAPNIMQAVADYMGKPIGALREMAAEGQITADVIKNAIFNATEQVNEDFNNMNLTFGQTVTKLKNDAIKALEPILDKINQIFNSEKFQDFVQNVSGAISWLVDVLSGVFDGVITICNALADNWDYVKIIIYGAVGALMAYNAQLIVLKVQSELAKANMMLLTDEIWNFNAALNKCPLAWVVGAIVVILGLMDTAIQKMGEVEGQSVSTLGVVAGSFGFVGSMIYNIVIFVLNSIITFVVSLINLIGQVGYAIKWFVHNALVFLANAILDIIDLALELSQLFVDLFDHELSYNIFETREAVRKWRDNTEALKYEEWDNPLALNPDDFTLAYADTEKWSVAAYEFGEGLEKDIKGLLSSAEDVGNDKINDANASADINIKVTPYEDLINDIPEMKDDVSSIKKSLDITEDDLKYLRDIAEQEAINRFTTAEIKIDMQNNNSINSDMDIDGIVTQLEDKLYESMSIAAEGAY